MSIDETNEDFQESLRLAEKLGGIYKNDIIIDDRLYERPATRMVQMEKLGIPIMIILGKAYNESKKLEIQNRITKEVLKLSLEDTLEYIEKCYKNISIQQHGE